MEIPGRFENEKRLTARIDAAFASEIRGPIRRRESPNWAEAERRVRDALRDEQLAVFIVMLLLFWDDWSSRLGIEVTRIGQAEASKLGTDWVNQRSSTIAGQLIENIKGDLGASPDRLPTRSRAETVATSEVTRAGSAGVKKAQKEIEREGSVKMTRVWVTERDAKVCPICRPLDGQPEWVWSKEFLDGPYAHPNCRCELILMKESDLK